MKSQMSPVSGVQFNVKFLIEILLVVIAGAIIFFVIVLKAKPELISGAVAKFAYTLYNILGIGK